MIDVNIYLSELHIRLIRLCTASIIEVVFFFYSGP